MTTEHKDLTDAHIPYAWEYADATEREAGTGFADADVGKLARQLDDNTLWMLTATTPTWIAVGGGGGGTLGNWSSSGGNYYGPLVQVPQDANVPAVAGWSWINQGSSVATDLPGGGISLKIPDNASANWRALSYTPPGTPYSAVFYLRALQFGINSQTVGVYFYDGTKLMGTEMLSQASGVWNIRVQKMTNVTTASTTPATLPSPASGWGLGGIWYKLRNDGSTLYFDYSIDGGKFYNIYSEAVGTFITPTKVCFGGLSVVNNAAYFIQASLLGFYMPANATL